MNFRNWIHKNFVPRNFMALHSVSLAAIKGSFQIWTCHNHTNVEWTCMYHLSPSTPLYHKIFHFYMYSNLRASNSTPNGRTKAILLEIGLYQGDPLSVTIFRGSKSPDLAGDLPISLHSSGFLLLSRFWWAISHFCTIIAGSSVSGRQRLFAHAQCTRMTQHRLCTKAVHWISAQWSGNLSCVCVHRGKNLKKGTKLSRLAFDLYNVYT